DLDPQNQSRERAGLHVRYDRRPHAPGLLDEVIMLDQDKVFEMMYGLLDLHDQMSRSTFTSMSMVFLCATLQALESAPPMVRLRISRAVTEFIDDLTREGAENQAAWWILEQLGVSLQSSSYAHAQYLAQSQNWSFEACGAAASAAVDPPFSG